MKNLTIALTLVLCIGLAGCLPREIMLNAVAPNTTDATYACALRLVNERGYHVTVEDKAVGFISGDRAAGQHGLTHEGHIDHDLLTVKIVSDGGSSRLQIGASTMRDNTFLTQTQSQMIAPSKAVKADADTLVSACMVPVTKGLP